MSAGPNFLRREIASGRPVFVYAARHGVPGIVEAARVSGRLGDLCVVLGGEDGVLPDGATAGWVRLAPPDVLRPSISDGGLRVRDVPHVAWGEVDWARAILVAVGTQAQEIPGWVEDAWADMADAAGRAGMGRVCRLTWDGRHHVKSRMPAFREEGFPFLEPVTGMVYRVTVGPDAAAGPAVADGDRWETALAAFRCGTVVERGDGVAVVRSAGRAVVAAVRVERHPSEPDGRRRLQIYEIAAPGMVVGAHYAHFDGSAIDGDLAARRAVEVWQAGIEVCERWYGRLASGDHVRLAALMRQADTLDGAFGDGLLDEGSPALAVVRAEIEARCDVLLLRAIRHARCVQGILARVEADPALRERRREFCLTWGVLSDMLLDPAVAQAVDAREPVIPLVAGMLGVGRGLARRLVGRPRMPYLFSHCLDGAGPGEGRRCSGWTFPVGDMLRAVGPDRLPARGDGAEWDGFVRYADFVFRSMSWASIGTRRIPVEDIAGLLVGAGRAGSWESRAASLDMDRDERCVADLLRSLGEWLAQFVPSQDWSVAFRILARHGSVPRLLEAARLWHETPALSANTGGLPRSVAWPVPFDPVDLGGGWHAVALDDVGALVDEGGAGPDGDGAAGLCHCVGSYAGKAQTGACLIVSLRLREGGAARRLSTVELVPVAAGGDVAIAGRPYAVAQHRGARNAAPSAEADGKLLRLLAMLGEGAVPVRAGALASREAVKVDGSMDRDGVLLAAWRPILPGFLRETTLDGLVDLARALEAESGTDEDEATEGA